MSNNKNTRAGVGGRKGKQNHMLLYCSHTKCVTGYDLKVGCFKLSLFILIIIYNNSWGHEKAKVKQVDKWKGDKELRR